MSKLEVFMSPSLWFARALSVSSLAVGVLSSSAFGQAAAQKSTAQPSCAEHVQNTRGAYDTRDFTLALRLAQEAENVCDGVDKVLPLQLWVRSAEERGDLPAMEAGLGAYARLADLGEGSGRFIDAARLRLAFYVAERGGRIPEAAVALKSAEEKAAGSAAWVRVANERLEVRRLLEDGRRAEALARAEKLADSPGVGIWVDAVRAQVKAEEAQGRCDFGATLSQLAKLRDLPGLTEAERDRVELLKDKVEARSMIKAGDLTGARVRLTKVERTAPLSANDQAWLSLYRLRVDLDEAWVAGRQEEVLGLREHYGSLRAKVRGEPGCMEPGWGGEVVAGATTPDESSKKKRRKRVSNWLFVGAGGAAVAAGAMAGVTARAEPEWEDAREDYINDHGSDAGWDSYVNPPVEEMWGLAASYSSLALVSASLLTVGLVVRW